MFGHGAQISHFFFFQKIFPAAEVEGWLSINLRRNVPEETGTPLFFSSSSSRADRLICRQHAVNLFVCARPNLLRNMSRPLMEIRQETLRWLSFYYFFNHRQLMCPPPPALISVGPYLKLSMEAYFLRVNLSRSLISLRVSYLKFNCIHLNLSKWKCEFKFKHLSNWMCAMKLSCS